MFTCILFKIYLIFLSAFYLNVLQSIILKCIFIENSSRTVLANGLQILQILLDLFANSIYKKFAILNICENYILAFILSLLYFFLSLLERTYNCSNSNRIN